MKKLILTTAVVIFGATAIHAQELRRADVPVEATPKKEAATSQETVMEKANSLKELHGRLHTAIQTIDKQMASAGKEEQIKLSQEKEQLTMSVRAVEHSLGEVSSATDANMNDVMSRAAAAEKRGNDLLTGGR